MASGWFDDLKNKQNKSIFEHEVLQATETAKKRILKGKSPKIANLIKEYDDLEEPKGKATAICKECNKQFNQRFSKERNAYSSWRICPECRIKRAQEKERKIGLGKEREVQSVKLNYDPYPWQREVEEEFYRHRFCVMACGNRAGKDRCSTMIGIKYFVKCLNENRHVDNPTLIPSVFWWMIAPTEKMARQNWRELKQNFPREWIVAVSDSDFRMQTIGNGIIEVRSGYTADDLVGVGLDLVTITEAARFKDLLLAWANLEARLGSPGRGLKEDRKGQNYGTGKALINSSPVPGDRDFYELWQRGDPKSDNHTSDWWSAHYPWTVNPANQEQADRIVQTKYGPVRYEEMLRRQIGDRVFRSNYLAEFLEEESCVFKDFERKCVINLYSQEATKCKTDKERKEFLQKWQAPAVGESYAIGYDPATGSSGDNPVVVIRNLSTNQIVRAYDLYGKNYEEQVDFIVGLSKTFNYAEIRWLRTGHTALEGQFQKRGVLELPIDEQGTKKSKLVQTLEIAVENGDVKVLYDDSPEISTLVNEMCDYSEKSGRYSNNRMPHDDFVSAMYAAFSDYAAFQDVPIYYCNILSSPQKRNTTFF